MRGRGPRCDDGDEPAAPPDLARLDVPSLRAVTAAMALLRGGTVERHDEPPKPPPPEDLADLAVRRGEDP
jgi:hypothetical protein